jgi:phosphoglycolate phosphatase
MQKKRLIIFDLDGTLINTVKDLNIAVNYALKQYNYPLRSIEQTTADIGNGVAKLIERSIPGGLNNPNYTECLATFKTYYKAHYFENSFPYQNVKETLNNLKETGYLLAVVSNKFDEGAKKLVNFYLPNIFDRIQGSIPELNYKPSSDLVNKVLKELDVNTNEALYVGDTNVDYETAVNSNLDCVLVSYGYRNEEYLKEHTKNSPIISDLSELIVLLK